MIPISDPRPTIGFRRWLRAVCLTLLCLGLLQATAVQAAPIPTTTIGFHTVSGAVGNYYNGGAGPNVGIECNTANAAGGGVLNGLINPIFSVPAGFTGGFSVEAINVAIGFAINVYDGENGTGTLLVSQGFSLNGNTTASVSFAGTAKSVVLARWSGNPFYDNFTFGSATVGTPVSEPPAVTTLAASDVTTATATLNATINPAGTATTAQFEYGTTPSYGSTVSVNLSPNDGTTTQTVSANLTGLAAGTPYYFRVTAANSAGSRNGSELTFTTPVRPAVTGLTGGGLFRFNNQGFTLGYEFTVSQTITVDRLGFYDEGNDGLVTAHDVGIYDLCGTLRTSGTVLSGTGSTLNGNYRYVSVTPVVLAAGTYRIGAVVFNGGSNDRFLRGVTTVATDSIVTYVRGKINNGVAALQFPTLDATSTGLSEKGCFGPNFTFSPGGTPPGEPESNLQGNGISIADGDSTPDTADHTGFGSTLVTGGTVVRTYTIKNTGTANLVVSGISKGGTHATDFTVGTLSPASPIPAASSATFTVTFDPSAVGLRTATISIASNDCDENPYDFAVEGTGTLPPATALHFDGVNDSVDIPHSAGQLSYPFTVEAWVKTTDADGILVSKYVGSSGNGWQMGMGGGKLTAWFFRPGGAIFPSGAGIVGATTINNGAWHHVAFVVDATGGRLFVDGVSDGFSGWTSGTPGPATTTAPVRLGNETTGYLYPFAGTLDEVRLWSVARSAAELQANKNSELAVMPPCLVGYYKFNQGTADGSNAGVTSLVDATDGASGTLNNFALTGPTSNWTTGSGITAVTSVPDPTAPDINLKGNAASIVLGDTTPSPADHTDFGSTPVSGGSVVRTFTVENTGPGASALNVASIAVSGTHAANFTVGALTPPGSIAGGGSATFTVTFLPGAVGLRSATVTVNNDDCNESAYSFAIQGTGVNTAPTVAVDAASVTVPEGTTAFNSGTFADANSDTVTITASVGSITQSGAGTWTHQRTLTQGGNPIELVLDSQENLYVANSSQNTIYKYSAAGSLVTSWTVTGNPTGVAVDSANGWLYVALKSGHRIDKFTLSGTLLTSWGSAGSGDGQFNLPHCVAVDASGDVYVSDSFNSRIQVFSSSGTFLRKWGSSGSGNGQFNFPQGLRISPGGTLYVADRSNHRVQYFDTAGTFLGKWGSAGSGNGQFNDPAGIGIDPGGNVVVGDIFNNRIQKFTATGTFVDKLGPATAAGNLALPHGTAFPPSGRSVYIADHNNGRVVKFATPGGWNWSYTPADGAAGPATVTITATDNGSPNLSSTTTFTLNVNNVAPTIALTGAATVPNGTPYTLNLGAITDPGTDTVTAFSINWGDGNTENFTGNPANTSKPHTYASTGAKTITVTLTDEDGTFTGGTKAITVENTPPVAPAQTFVRAPGLTLKIKIADVLAACSDTDGGTLALASIGTSAQGATVVRTATHLLYTLVANANDSFSYTITDGQGGSTSGTLNVSVVNPGGLVQSLTPGVGAVTVNFAGIPGFGYDIQRATSPAGPWTTVATSTAPANGLFSYTDPSPPQPTAFYRLQQSIAP